MEYKLNGQEEIIIDGPNSLESVKRNLISLLTLSEEERASISGIQNTQDLSKFLDVPDQYLTWDNVKALQELLELIDLLGGMYFA